MIFAFDHKHDNGDLCSQATCAHARRAPVLAGNSVYQDIPMLIVRKATKKEYLTQPVPAGWSVPQLLYGCRYIYEVLIGPPRLIYPASSGNLCTISITNPVFGTRIVEVGWVALATPQDLAECKAWMVEKGMLHEECEDIHLAPGESADTAARLLMYEGRKQ